MHSFRATGAQKLLWYRHKWRHSLTHNDVSDVGIANHNWSSVAVAQAMARLTTNRAARVQIPTRTLGTFLAVFQWLALSFLSNWVPECSWYSWAPWEVKAVERGTYHPTSLRAVCREYVKHRIPLAPFTARAHRTGDTFTFLSEFIGWSESVCIYWFESFCSTVCTASSAVDFCTSSVCEQTSF